MKSILISLLLLFIIVPDLTAQQNFHETQNSVSSNDYPNVLSLNKSFLKNRSETTSSTLPIAIGLAAFFYLLNPIILFENDKIALGFTKELSVGFGNFGEHRATAEYSYIFRKDLNSNIRLGYKYDILLKKGIQPSNSFQGTTTLTLGGGYFHNFSRPGVFAESSFGYSIRNHKILFYPSAKLRYTYVAKGANIIDFSFGIVVGIANPFIDMKIRQSKRKDDE
ncbi:MAG: hypothetical protein ABIY50_01160 [Ignavibacteria bacterium]